MIKKLPKVISVEEFNQILHVTKKPHYRLAFKLGFLCGLRVSEVVKLKQEDIERDRGFIFIRQGKGGKDRYVPIPKPLLRDLRGIPIKIGIRALELAINKMSEKALGRRTKFHTLRHSCATYYLNKGMPIRQVQLMLGHSRINITEIYLHASPDDIRKSVDSIWQ